ncbi:MAG: hypothetical protein RXO22_01640 [Thermocladium sp.]|jgi:hypothetical protein
MHVYVLVAGLLLGLAHGIEPDHLASISLSQRGFRSGLYFGISHGLGFATIAIPLILVINAFPVKQLLSEAAALISIAVGILVLYVSVRGIDLELGPRGSRGLGFIQGALALTPTKVLLIALAATASIFMGIASLLLFAAGSILVMSIYGFARFMVPRNMDRAISVLVSIASIIYAALML